MARAVTMTADSGTNADGASVDRFVIPGTRLDRRWWVRVYRFDYYDHPLCFGATRMVVPDDGDTSPWHLAIGEVITIDGDPYRVGVDSYGSPTLTLYRHTTEQENQA